MNRTNIYLSDRQLDRLEHLSVFTGLSRAELVRRAVDEYLDRQENQRQKPPVPGGVEKVARDQQQDVLRTDRPA